MAKKEGSTKEKKARIPKSKGVTKKKAKKDENAPKRNKNAYMFFCEAQRETVKKDKPDIGAKQILKELGERWKKLTDDQKKVSEIECFCNVLID